MFGNQGDLYGNAMTWWDHGTGSVWSQPTGEAILGPLKGAKLELLSSNLTTWDAWRDRFPDTGALDGPSTLTRVNLSQTTIVVDFSLEVMTFRFIELWQSGPANEVVADVPVAVVTDPEDRDRWAVFDRRVGELTLTFEVRGSQLHDSETGTVWDPVFGLGLEGELAGETLAKLPAFTAFPRDVETFWPGARVWQPG